MLPPYIVGTIALPNPCEKNAQCTRERRYFEVYHGCLALANALSSEVEWHISSH